MTDTIFDLITGNLFILALIIGGIISFLKRLLNKQNDAPKNHRARKPQPVEHHIEPYEEKTRTVERIDQRLAKEATRDLQELYETTQSGIPAETGHSLRSHQPRGKGKTVKRPKGKLVPDPNHVAQGIIWSEVLGQPRSRKPHRTMSRTIR